MTASDLQASPVAPRLSLLDRLLPVWIFAAMGLGVGLGRVFPELGTWLDSVKVANVSAPIALGLLLTGTSAQGVVPGQIN